MEETVAMRVEVKGPRIAMVTSTETEDVAPNSLLFTVQLSDVPRQIRLKLDSGATASVLYNPSQFQAPQLVRKGLRHERGTDGAERNLAALTAQRVKIGPLELPDVPFFAPATSGKNTGSGDFDGLLSTGLFRRVFIAHAEHFAVLEVR